MTSLRCMLVIFMATMTGLSGIMALTTSPFVPRFFDFSQSRRYESNSAATLMTMGLDVKIRIVGRKNASDRWVEDAYNIYHTRLRSSSINVETVWHKTNDDLLRGIQADNDKAHSVVLLDPLGKSRTSEQFSNDMYTWLNEGGSRLTFVIGGAEGLPSELKHGGKGHEMQLFSLSYLTLTHQFARTLLMEQIYRASEIRKGSGYHK